MWPTAIVLDYSVKNIQNNVCQMYIYIYKFYNFEIVCAQVKASLYPQPLNVVSTLCPVRIYYLYLSKYSND